MIRENINYIEKIFEKNEKFSLVIYFFFSILISILETIGIGIIPAFFSVLIDQNIINNKLDFNDNLQVLVINFLNSEKYFSFYVLV